MIIADKTWPWIGRLLCVLIVVALNGCTEVPILQPESPAFEKTFYNESDIGTNAYQLTANPGEDSIFYQNTSFFSPDGSKFLFRQEIGEGIYMCPIPDLKDIGPVEIALKVPVHSPCEEKHLIIIYEERMVKVELRLLVNLIESTVASSVFVYYR